MILRRWPVALGCSILFSSPSAQTPTLPPAASLRFDDCREVTLLFRNVSTDAERTALPGGFIARRNNFGRPIFWFQNVFCESIGVNAASGRPGAYSLLVAGIIPPDERSDPAMQHFYIVDAVTNMTELHDVLRSAGIPNQLVDELRVSGDLNQATVTASGRSPFTVSVGREVPTIVHSHNWWFWHATESGRAVLNLAVQSGVGSRGTGVFQGTSGTKLDEILREQPIFSALNEPMSAQATVDVHASAQ
jgi:hypothetical protein